MNLVMRTLGRHAEVIKRMIELTGCESREITHNREVTSFITDAEHGRIGTLIFKG